MSIKKNVAIVDGKALNAPPTPEKQSSPPAEVKLDDKIVRAFLSDPNIYDLWKKLADVGGMKIDGVKDAAHLEEIINKAKADLIEARWEEIINKHRSEGISSPKNGNDLPNGKPLPTLGEVKRAYWHPKKKDAFYYCVPGHYGANQ